MATLAERADHLRRGLRDRGFKVIEQEGVDLVTPVIPVLVEDDWKAALLWKALYEAGVFVNVAIHPAVPPGGALLRTSVMATHDEATLDRALGTFSDVKQAFEREHGPLPSP
jgi:8-amino-7-oxononanoate synthase